MKYFVQVTKDYAVKNSLEKSIREELIKVDNNLLIKISPKELCKKLEQIVHDLNAKHPRCRPKQIYTHCHDGVWIIGITDVIYIQVDTVKREL